MKINVRLNTSLSAIDLALATCKINEFAERSYRNIVAIDTKCMELRNHIRGRMHTNFDVDITARF